MNCIWFVITMTPHVFCMFYVQLNNERLSLQFEAIDIYLGLLQLSKKSHNRDSMQRSYKYIDEKKLGFMKSKVHPRSLNYFRGVT